MISSLSPPLTGNLYMFRVAEISRVPIAVLVTHGTAIPSRLKNTAGIEGEGHSGLVEVEGSVVVLAPNRPGREGVTTHCQVTGVTGQGHIATNELSRGRR